MQITILFHRNSLRGEWVGHRFYFIRLLIHGLVDFTMSKEKSPDERQLNSSF